MAYNLPKAQKWTPTNYHAHDKSVSTYMKQPPRLCRPTKVENQDGKQANNTGIGTEMLDTTARREIGKWLNEQPNSVVDREALARLCAEHDRMTHALATMLGETDDSDYMSASEQRAMARRALPPNAANKGRA